MMGEEWELPKRPGVPLKEDKQDFLTDHKEKAAFSPRLFALETVQG